HAVVSAHQRLEALIGRLIAGFAVLAVTSCAAAGHVADVARSSPLTAAGVSPSEPVAPSTPVPTVPATVAPTAVATLPPTPRPTPHPTARPATSATTIVGCPVFPADNPWNQDVSHAALNPNSQTYINRIDSFRQFLHPDFGSNP